METWKWRAVQNICSHCGSPGHPVVLRPLHLKTNIPDSTGKNRAGDPPGCSSYKPLFTINRNLLWIKLLWDFLQSVLSTHVMYLTPQKDILFTRCSVMAIGINFHIQYYSNRMCITEFATGYRLRKWDKCWFWLLVSQALKFLCNLK